MGSRAAFRAACTGAVLLMGCNSGGDSGGNTGPDADFAPTSNVTLTGNLTYRSVTIPTGVIVTASADMVLTVVNDVSVAGTLTAPCHALTVSAGGVVTVTGAVRNECADGITAAALMIIGNGGYSYDGAVITSSGDMALLDGPTLPQLLVQAVSPARAAGKENLGGAVTYRCNLVNTTLNSTPLKRNKGADGTPQGDSGKAGASKTSGCGFEISGQTGGTLHVSGLTFNGGSGGDGGKGTSFSSTPAIGGNGGPPGAMNLVSDEDIVFDGTTTMNGGDAGDGGDGVATNTADGGNATATGGKGANLTPKNFSSPVTIKAGGTITINGTINVKLGRAGVGGDAVARAGTGATGNPPGKGGDANAAGGNGGDSHSLNVNYSGSIGGQGGVSATGGAAGGGGDAHITVGNGGASTLPGGDAGPAGGGHALAGNGGRGLVAGSLRDGSSATAMQQGGPGLDAAGGAAGSVFADGGNGGKGTDNCSPAGNGGHGGPGGSLVASEGAPGNGNPSGRAGDVNVTNAFFGGDGGAGLAAGIGGTASVATLTHPAGITGPFNIVNSFLNGANGALCGMAVALTVTPPVQIVAENGDGSIHAVLTRKGLFAGFVVLTIRDHLGAVRASATIPAGSTVLDLLFAVPASFVLGTNTWTATASATGIADVVQTFQVTVTAPSGVSVVGQNCDPTHAILGAAYYDGIGTAMYTNLSIVNQTFAFTLQQSTGALAIAKDRGNGGVSIEVLQLAANQMAAAAAGYCAATTVGTASVVLNLTGLAAGNSAFIAIGDRSTSFSATPATLTTVKAAPTVDIVAARQVAINSFNAYAIIRGATIPGGPFSLDFTTGITPATAVITATNSLGENLAYQARLRTATGTDAITFRSAVNNNTLQTVQVMPAAQLLPGDLIAFVVSASGGGDSRQATVYSNSVFNPVIALPPGIINTVSQVGTAPALLRSVTTAPTGVDALAKFSVTQTVAGVTKTFTIWTSKEWNAGSGNYSQSMPNLITAGFQPSWWIQSGMSVSTGQQYYSFLSALAYLTAPIVPGRIDQSSFWGATFLPQ
jgi:hypothetical protein